MAWKLFSTTRALPGDREVTLLSKILQVLGGDVSLNETVNTALAKILGRLDGIAVPGDTSAQLLAKILSQLVCDFDSGTQAGAGSPVGVVTPTFSGQLYHDTTADSYWRSTGLTSADWVEILGAGLLWGPSPTTLSSVAGATDAYINLLDGSKSDLDFGNPVTVTNDVTFAGSTALNSLRMRNLEAVNGGGIDLSLATNLLTADFPKLRTVAGSLNANGDSVLASVNVPLLETLSGDLNFGSCFALAELSLPSLQSIGGTVDLTGCFLMTEFICPLLVTSGTLTVNTASIVTISLPSLTNFPNFITADSNLLTLNLPACVDDGGGGGGNFQGSLNSMPNLTTLNMNSLTSFSGSIAFFVCPDIASVNFSSLVTSGALDCGGWKVANLSLPALTTVTGNFLMDSNPLMVSFSAPLWVPTNGTTIDFNGDSLDAASVNHILARCVAAGLTTATINLSGGSNAAPTGQGILDKATLIGNGCTVTTN